LEEKMVAKTNRFGVLAAVRLVVLMVVVEVRPAEATFPGKTASYNRCHNKSVDQIISRGAL
jgi:hypothetical protein